MYALLAVERGDLIFSQAVAATGPRTLRYSVSVHAFSNLRMRAQVSQSSLEPGAQLTLRAILTEYGVPVDHRATVETDVERPDGTSTTLPLAEVEAGVFEGGLMGALEGVYRFRVRASGGTMRGEPFTREQLLTAAILRGGDQPPPRSDPQGDAEAKALCELLRCLLGPNRFGRVLQQHGVDVGAVRKCLDAWCRRRLGPPSEKELRAREGVAAARPEVSSETTALTDRMIATVADMLRHATRERGADIDELRGQ